MTKMLQIKHQVTRFRVKKQQLNVLQRKKRRGIKLRNIDQKQEKQDDENE